MDKEQDQEFAAELRQVRRRKSLTQRDAADEIGITPKTLGEWEQGKRTPCHELKRGALLILRAYQGGPSESEHAKLQNSHHLHWEDGRGWVLRFTVEINKKMVGKRIKVRLRTRDLTEAIARRELIVSQYQRLGLKIANRKQRRVGE